MSKEVKIITFEDAMDLARDEAINASVRDGMGDGAGMVGIVSMKDNTGRVVFEKRHNIIVLRGRTFALERLFNDTIGYNIAYGRIGATQAGKSGRF